MTKEEKLEKFYKLVVVEDEQEDYVYLTDKVKRSDLEFLQAPTEKQFTEAELEVLEACFEFIRDGNIGFDAIEGRVDLDYESFEAATESLNYKF